ncbi:hypothetical protein [Natrinema caseinilyticum]|uniref:hypothetical protein n=1 Tax=Natrinema caseinilyticum TaxID=2961570 RepID=UPI0020C254F9|nr:hypothetical protein [Natrinema caseinilyticum]
MHGDVDFGSVFEVKVTKVTNWYLVAEVLEKVRHGPSKHKMAQLGNVDGSEDVVASKNNNLRGLR